MKKAFLFITLSMIKSIKYLFILSLITLVSCSEEFSPKPKGFNRIDLPPPKYQQLQEEHPYTFEYSVYAEVLKDTSKFAEKDWIDLWYPEYKSNIQITYKSLNKEKKTLQELINDSYRLQSGHQKKATAIDESIVRLDNGMTATVFQLQGEVPSQFQFYVTDSTDNFLRGALYFRTALKNDSLAPVINYMKEDIMHLLNTLEWKKK